jgi:hypothetical protein
LVVALGIIAQLFWSAAPASGRAPDEPFTRTVEPLDPADPPSNPPIFNLTAACVRQVGRGRYEAVFGHVNHTPSSAVVRLRADGGQLGFNVILRSNRYGKTPVVAVEELGPQATLFKPGRHPHEFAVRFREHERVAWQVVVPAEGNAGFWKITVEPRMDVRCTPRVPDHFTVIQHVRVTTNPVNVLMVPPGHVAGYEMEFDVRDIRVACSTGGELVATDAFVGWPQGMNVEPAEPDYLVVVTLSGGTVVYEMTRPSARPVADIFQEVSWLGPIADVGATCQFADETVTSDVFWGEQAGHFRVVPTIEDGNVIGIGFSGGAPVGSRLR